MTQFYFVTGTDTDSGKTYVSVCLLNTFKQLGYTALGLKPISCGGDDAQLLQQAASISLPLSMINPIAFDLPIAPHLAAKIHGVELSVDNLVHVMHPALSYPADIHIIEGAGGLLVPLNHRETMADFIDRCRFSIILVVGIRVGCLNHALLTAASIESKSLPFAGWIANSIQENIAETDDMINTLRHWIRAPYLGRVHHKGDKLVSPDENACKLPSASFINKRPY